MRQNSQFEGWALHPEPGHFDSAKITVAFMLQKLPRTRYLLPAHVCHLASRWLMRAIEITACRRRHLRFNVETLMVTILIPSSKTDIEGFGVRIRFVCSCPQSTSQRCGGKPPNGIAHLWMNCTYHVAVAYTLEVHGTLVPTSLKEGEQCFFATMDGGPPSLESLSSMVNAIAAQHPIDESDDDVEEVGSVRLKHSGHSFRRTGAREWHREGITDHLLKTLGRWSTEAWERYVAALPAIVIAPLKTTEQQSPTLAVHCALQDLNAQVSSLTKKTVAAGGTCQAGETLRTPPMQSMRFVISHPGETNATIHLLADFSGRRSSRRCKCGFRFGISQCDVETTAEEPQHVKEKCRDCYGLRQGRKPPPAAQARTT